MTEPIDHPSDTPDDGWVSLPEPPMPPGFDEVPIATEPPEGDPENLDPAGVAHFAVVYPDAGQPDQCGGCGAPWPCEPAYELGLAVREEEVGDDPDQTVDQV